MGRPEHIKAVLFDMDGTVIDSEGIKNAQLVDLLRSHGAVLGDHELDYISGADLKTLLDAMQAVLDRSGVEKDAMSVLETNPYGREDPYLDPACAPIEGVVDFLAELRCNGIKCVLVSNTPSYAVLYALNRFGMLPLFDAVIGGDMLAKHKPDPEGYALAMRLIGAEPGECVVIEDSTSGIVAGVAAGAYVCARDDGSGVHDLSAAHETFSSYADLRLW